MESSDILVRVEKKGCTALDTNTRILIETVPSRPHTPWRDLGFLTIGAGVACLFIYITRERSLVDTMKTVAINKIPTQGKWFPF